MASGLWQLVLVGAGGSAGAIARHGMTLAVHSFVGRGFPWGTLAVNAAGCLAMGALVGAVHGREAAREPWQLALGVGFLGAFTTFSAFSAETLALLRRGEHGLAGLNIAGSVALCLAAVWAGWALARALTPS